MPDPSPKFEKVCQQVLNGYGELTPVAKDRIVENLRLQFEYPGQYVAYVDRFKTIEKVRRLCREVIATGRSSHDVQEAVRSCPPQDRTRVVVEYVDNEPELLYELR